MADALEDIAWPAGAAWAEGRVVTSANVEEVRMEGVGRTGGEKAAALTSPDLALGRGAGDGKRALRTQGFSVRARAQEPCISRLERCPLWTAAPLPSNLLSHQPILFPSLFIIRSPTRTMTSPAS